MKKKHDEEEENKKDESEKVEVAEEAEKAPENDSRLATGDSRKTELLRKILRQIQANTQAALQLLDDGHHPNIASLLTAPVDRKAEPAGRVVEGAFDGQRMIGEDGQTYPVPPNYASKSKLVPGDRLKLIIPQSGNFIFKQIGPVERDRIVGTLAMDPATKQFVVTYEGKQWKVLTASVTFFHGDPGDETVVLVPKEGPSAWAAVENIMKRA